MTTGAWVVPAILVTLALMYAIRFSRRKLHAEADRTRALATIERMGRAGCVELMRELGWGSGRTYMALWSLEADGHVQSVRETPEPVGRPARRLYVPSPGGGAEEER